MINDHALPKIAAEPKEKDGLSDLLSNERIDRKVDDSDYKKKYDIDRYN